MCLHAAHSALTPWPRCAPSSGPLTGCWRDRSHLVYLQHEVSMFVGIKRRRKLRAPFDLVITVRVARMHGLAESIIEPFDQDQYFRLQPLQVRRGLSVKRATLIHRVDNSPSQGKEIDGRALQPEYMV